LERDFIDDKIKLGALQNELDAYFPGGGPGQALHRLSDLIMIMYFKIVEVPATQLEELILAVPGETHTGLTVEQMRRRRTFGRDFSDALDEVLRSLMSSPLRDKPHRARPRRRARTVDRVTPVVGDVRAARRG